MFLCSCSLIKKDHAQKLEGNDAGSKRSSLTEYTLFNDKNEIKKVLLIHANNDKAKIITAEISNEFKLASVAKDTDEAVIKYIPNKETINNWSKMISLEEVNPKKWERARQAALK